MALDTVGTVIEIGDGATPTEAFNDFCVNSIDPIGFARTLIDVTTLCSTAREYRLALTDGQEINIEAFYDPSDAVQRQLRTALINGDEVHVRIVLSDGHGFGASPTGTTITFTALVMNWSTGAAVDGVYPLRVTLKPITQVTITEMT